MVKIMKPLAVYDYTQKMAGVDKHDQFNTYYNPPRRYSNTFCTLAGNEYDEKGKCNKVLV